MKHGLVLALVALALCPMDGAAQQDSIGRQIRERQQRLDEIRQERDGLEQQRSDLRRRARDATEELELIRRQRNATARIVNELDRQVGQLATQLDTITVQLIFAEEHFAERQAVLERRLVDIYKRGNLWAVRALLAAESFGDLISRYKYLYAVSRQDRVLRDEVEALRDEISVQRRDLLQVRNTIDRQRAERDVELREFIDLDRQRQRTLSQLTRNEQQTNRRIDSLAASERELAALIASLARGGSGAAGSGVGSISRADLAGLDWPVEGTVVYEFGTEPFRGATQIVRGGIGIAVPEGTPVRAVREGVVRRTQPQRIFGPSVFIDHGGGYLTVYLYLSEVTVAVDQRVNAGQIIGLSGGAQSAEGPHIQFQIWESQPDVPGQALALDPRNWLRAR